MGIDVREADLGEARDCSALLDLLVAYASDPMAGGRPLTAEARGAIVPGLRSHPGALALLAWDGEDAVGVAVCFVGFSTFRGAPLLNLHDLAVRGDRRGRGIGRQLLAAVERHAIRLGCCKLTLEVREDNARARGLYAGFGFGDRPGEATRTLFLEKPLADAR